MYLYYCFLFFYRAHTFAEKFLNQRNGEGHHTIHAMGHAHIDSGNYTNSIMLYYLEQGKVSTNYSLVYILNTRYNQIILLYAS